MKALTTIFAAIAISCFSQDSLKVVKVENERARQLIEVYTENYCKPDVIKFALDGAGNWIMSVENLSNPRFTQPDTIILKQFLEANEVLQPFRSIGEIMAVYGVEINYTPIAEPPEN